MIHRQVEEFDIRKLEEARNLIQSVMDYYYTSRNSRNLCNRLDTILYKLTDIINDAREYQSTHYKWEGID